MIDELAAARVERLPWQLPRSTLEAAMAVVKASKITLAAVKIDLCSCPSATKSALAVPKITAAAMVAKIDKSQDRPWLKVDFGKRQRGKYRPWQMPRSPLAAIPVAKTARGSCQEKRPPSSTLAAANSAKIDCGKRAVVPTRNLYVANKSK